MAAGHRRPMAALRWPPLMAAWMAAWMAAPRLVDSAAELDRSTAAAPRDGRHYGRPAWLSTRSTDGRPADMAAAADRPPPFRISKVSSQEAVPNLARISAQKDFFVWST